MLWVCLTCTTTYAVGLSRCPNCNGTDFCEQGEIPPGRLLPPEPETPAVKPTTGGGETRAQAKPARGKGKAGSQ